MNITMNSVLMPVDCEKLASYFVKYNNNKYNKALKYISLIATAVFAFMGLLALFSLHIKLLLLCIAGIIIVWLFVVFSLTSVLPGEIKRLNMVNCGNRSFTAFYDDYFYDKTESPLCVTEQSVSYELIKTALETPEHFFLFGSNNMYYIIPKRDLTPQSVYELSSFLSFKLPGAFKRVK